MRGSSQLADEGLSAEGIEMAAESLVDGTAESGAGVRADKVAVFEQRPFLDGKQLVHCRLALAYMCRHSFYIVIYHRHYSDSIAVV